MPGEESERDIDLLAVAQDRGRDCATLFEAIEGTDLRLVVVCRPENLAGLAVPGNVEVLGTRFNAEHMWSELAAEMRARGMI